MTEPRFRRLARALGMTVYEAIGRVLFVWLLAYERRCARLLVVDVDLAADLEGFAASMIAADLATLADEDAVLIRGVTDRIEFLLRHAEDQARKGRRSGEVRRERAAHANSGENDTNRPRTAVRTVVPNGRALPLAGDASSASPMVEAPTAFDAERSLRGARKPARKRATETPLPEGWEPNAGARELAAQLGVDLGAEAAHFKDHVAAKDVRWVDWGAAFRSWLRRASTFRRGGANTQKHTGRLEPRPAADYPDGTVPLEAL